MEIVRLESDAEYGEPKLPAGGLMGRVSEKRRGLARGGKLKGKDE